LALVLAEACPSALLACAPWRWCWQMPKKPKVKKATHIYFISSSDEEEPPMADEPPMAGSSSGGHGGPVHTYFSDSD